MSDLATSAGRLATVTKIPTAYASMFVCANINDGIPDEDFYDEGDDL